MGSSGSGAEGVKSPQLCQKEEVTGHAFIKKLLIVPTISLLELNMAGIINFCYSDQKKVQ